MARYSEGRRRAFLRRRKSTKVWENRTDQELHDIYWKLRNQHNNDPQFIAFCDFLKRKNKLDIIR